MKVHARRLDYLDWVIVLFLLTVFSVFHVRQMARISYLQGRQASLTADVAKVSARLDCLKGMKRCFVAKQGQSMPQKTESFVGELPVWEYYYPSSDMADEIRDFVNVYNAQMRNLTARRGHKTRASEEQTSPPLPGMMNSR